MTARPQYYVFQGTGPSDWGGSAAWVEAFDDLGHWVAPTPFRETSVALAHLTSQHVGALVDTIDGVEARGARAMAEGRVRCSGEVTGDSCSHTHGAL